MALATMAIAKPRHNGSPSQRPCRSRVRPWIHNKSARIKRLPSFIVLMILYDFIFTIYHYVTFFFTIYIANNEMVSFVNHSIHDILYIYCIIILLIIFMYIYGAIYLVLSYEMVCCCMIYRIIYVIASYYI